jgi:uncharacterized OB-fold protein
MPKIELPRCKYCGKSFIPNTAWQEYCKDAHRVADFRKKEKQKEKQKATPNTCTGIAQI